MGRIWRDIFCNIIILSTLHHRRQEEGQGRRRGGSRAFCSWLGSRGGILFLECLWTRSYLSVSGLVWMRLLFMRLGRWPRLRGILRVRLGGIRLLMVVLMVVLMVMVCCGWWSSRLLGVRVCSGFWGWVLLVMILVLVLVEVSVGRGGFLLRRLGRRRGIF